MSHITENIQGPHEMVVSILKDELANLPVAECPARIIIVDTPEAAQAAAKVLSNEKVIGFDTETKPCFKRGVSNNVALLQLSTHNTCYLIRLNKIGLTPEIKSILENPDIIKIGVSIHDDFHQMQKLYELEPSGFIDLQKYVKEFNILDNSLARIYGILFGKRISKNQRLTNWEADHLSQAQQEYAALDAISCIQIYDYLNTGVFSPEKSIYYRSIEEVRPIQPIQILPENTDTTSDTNIPNKKSGSSKRKK